MDTTEANTRDMPNAPNAPSTSNAPAPDAEATARARRTVYRSTQRRLTGPMRDFLARQPFAVIATQDADGRMHVVPVTYLFADDRFYVATSSASRKARNAAARPGVTITVDDRDSLTWVSATGTAEVLTGQRSREINDRLYQRSWDSRTLRLIEPFLHRTEDVTIAVTPRSWRSWDFRSTVLPALADAGIPRADLERMFPS